MTREARGESRGPKTQIFKMCLVSMIYNWISLVTGFNRGMPCPRADPFSHFDQKMNVQSLCNLHVSTNRIAQEGELAKLMTLRERAQVDKKYPLSQKVCFFIHCRKRCSKK